MNLALKGIGLPLLLLFLADQTAVIEGTTFRDVTSLTTTAVVMKRYGASTCGKLLSALSMLGEITMRDVSCLNISTCYEVPSVSDGLSLLKSTLPQARASSLAEYCLSSAAGCEHTEQLEPAVTKHCEIVHIMFKTMDELSIQLRNLNSDVLGVIVHLDEDCAQEQCHSCCAFSSHLNHHGRIVPILA